MSMTAASDEAHRSRIASDLTSTLFVEAGAGTGKTTALVGRIVNLIADGQATAPRLAAITFTEKAAAELQERVRRELERAAAGGSGLTPEAAARCRAALADLDRAAICTLHAFAQRVLAARPLEAGLPPLFKVQDDVQSTLGFQDRWDAWLDQFLTQPENTRLVRLITALGLKPSDLRALAGRFHANWDRLESFDAGDPSLPRVPDAGEVIAALRFTTEQGHRCRDRSDRFLKHLEWLEGYRWRLEASSDGPDRLRVLAERRKLSFGHGQQGNWPPGLLLELKKRLKEADETKSGLLRGLRAALAPPLVAALRGFALEWAAGRRRDGVLQFHDLLVLARDLLRDQPEVRVAVRQQWTHLLIDEFQDTDPLQAEIAVLLTGTDVDAVGWEQAAVEPGRLFFVGDPKQSIYRFRRADISLYRSVQCRFLDGEVRLTQNFRSQSTILEWVNAVFTRLWAGDGVGLQAPYLPLDPARWTDHPRVRVLGGPRDAANAEELRWSEADDLVRGVMAVRAGGWPVGAKREPTGATRPARYADIAILIPTRTSLPPLERALEDAGVPYRVESRSLVFSSREVQDLLAVLTAIDDPTDQVALIAALRSPVFACSDSALLAFAQAGGRWNYTRSMPDALPVGAQPVASAYQVLGSLHSQRAWVGLANVVERVVREQQLPLLAFAHRRPRDSWNRLRFMVDQARAFQESGGSTLRRFVDWVQRQAEEDRGIVEIVAPEQDDDAVRIMTVHASKGLEFPVVFLAGLNIERPNRSVGPALWGADGGLEVRLGAKENTFETGGYAGAEATEALHRQAEQHRLLYVACTRARDHLVLSLWHKQDDTKSHAAVLWGLGQDCPELWSPWEPAAAEEPPEPPAPFDDSSDRRNAWAEARRRLLAASAPLRAVAATAIAKAAAAAGKEEPVEESPPWRRGRAGTSIGRAVHSTLQTVDLATGEGLVAIAAAQAAAEGVPGRAAEVQRLVEAARRSNSVQDALGSGRYWREVYVSTVVGDRIVEGFIDLLYESAGGLVVVDYKTDNVPADADRVTALQRYRLQGAAYALALQQTLGRPVCSVVFVFVRAPVALELEVPDLDDAIREVAAAVGAMV